MSLKQALLFLFLKGVKMLFSKKKQQLMLEDLTDLYLIMKRYVTNPDSKKANILFLNLADDITNNGSKEFMDILGEKYLAENSAALAKGGDA